MELSGLKARTDIYYCHKSYKLGRLFLNCSQERSVKQGSDKQKGKSGKYG